MESFKHQVGGHPSTILNLPPNSTTTSNEASEMGSTLIKPSSEKELNFYTSMGSTLHPDFVGVWTPTFYGTLNLEGKLGPEGNVLKAELGEEGQQMLVLENLTHRFKKPNVLDVKLGTLLYDDDAPLEKQTRMKKVAQETTTFETGLRLTGFQVWDSTHQVFVKTDKRYGKALWSQHLPEAISKFFLLSPPYTFSSTFSSATSTSDLYTQASLPTSIKPQALPADLMRQVLRGILSQLYQLRGILNTLEFRMIGGSILIIFEGDEDALRTVLEREQEERRVALALVSKNRKGKGKEKACDLAEEMLNELDQSRTESTMIIDDDNDSQDFNEDDEEGSETDSISTSDSQGVALSHTLLSLDVRLIDFAHTRAVPGEGPDTGVLKGVDTLVELLEGLVRDLDVEITPVKNI